MLNDLEHVFALFRTYKRELTFLAIKTDIFRQDWFSLFCEVQVEWSTSRWNNFAEPLPREEKRL